MLSVPEPTIALRPPAPPGMPGTRRRTQPPELDPGVQRTVWHRDSHICRFCGFRALRYQDVVVLGGHAGDVDHMLTACQFCHQCFHLPSVVAMRSGVLLWLPGIAQWDLHHMARELYVARIARATQARANDLLKTLMERRKGAVEHLGTDDPKVLTQSLSAPGAADSPRLALDALDGIRLFPLDRRILRADEIEFNQFPQVLAYWRSADGPYHGENEFRWLTRLEQSLAEGAPAQPVEADDDPAATNAQLGARLLRNVAQFRRHLAARDPGLAAAMQSAAQDDDEIAQRLERDPLGDGTDASAVVPPERSVAAVAAGRLETAAALLESIAARAPALAEQLASHAGQLRELAHWVRIDPLARPED